MASYFIRNSTRSNQTAERSSDRAAAAAGAEPKRFFTQPGDNSIGASYDHHPEGSAQQLMSYYTMPETDPRHVRFHQHRLQVQLQQRIDHERSAKAARLVERTRRNSTCLSRRDSKADVSQSITAPPDPETDEALRATYVSVRFPQLAPHLLSSSTRPTANRTAEDACSPAGLVTAAHNFPASLPALSAKHRGGGGGLSARTAGNDPSPTERAPALTARHWGASRDDQAAAVRPVVKLLESYAVAGAGHREWTATTESANEPIVASTKIGPSVTASIIAPPCVPSHASSLLEASMKPTPSDGPSDVPPAAATSDWVRHLRITAHNALPGSSSAVQAVVPVRVGDAASILVVAPPVDSPGLARSPRVESDAGRSAMLRHHKSQTAEAVATNTNPAMGQSVHFEHEIWDDADLAGDNTSSIVKQVVSADVTAHQIASLIATFQKRLRHQHDYFVRLIYDHRAHGTGESSRLEQIVSLSDALHEEQQLHEARALENERLVQALDATKRQAAGLQQQLDVVQHQLRGALEHIDAMIRSRDESVAVATQTSMTCDSLSQLEEQLTATRAALRIAKASTAASGSMRLTAGRRAVGDADLAGSGFMTLDSGVFDSDVSAAPIVSVPVRHSPATPRGIAASEVPPPVMVSVAVATDWLTLSETASQTQLVLADFDDVTDELGSDNGGLLQSPSALKLAIPPQDGVDSETDSACGAASRTATMVPAQHAADAAIPESPSLRLEQDPYATIGSIALEIMPPESDVSDDDDIDPDEHVGRRESHASSSAATRKQSTQSSVVTVDSAPQGSVESPVANDGARRATETESRPRGPIAAPVIEIVGARAAPADVIGGPRLGAAAKGKPLPKSGLLGGDVLSISPRSRSSSNASKAGLFLEAAEKARRLSSASTGAMMRVPSTLTSLTAAQAQRESATKIDEAMQRQKRKTQAAVRSAMAKSANGNLSPTVPPPIGTVGLVAVTGFAEDAKAFTMLSSWMLDDVLNGGGTTPVFFDATTCVLAFTSPGKAIEFALDQVIASRFAFAVDVLSLDSSHVVGPFACYDAAVARGMQNLVSFSARGEIIIPGPVYKTYVTPLRDVLVVLKLEVTFHLSLDEVDLFSMHKEGQPLVPRSSHFYDPLLPLSQLMGETPGRETPQQQPLGIHGAGSVARFVRRRPPLGVRCTAPLFAIAHGSVAAGNVPTKHGHLYHQDQHQSAAIERHGMLIVYSNEKHPSVADSKEAFSVAVNAVVRVMEAESGPDEQTLITHATQTQAAKKRNVACGAGSTQLELAPLVDGAGPQAMLPKSLVTRSEVEVEHGSDQSDDDSEHTDGNQKDVVEAAIPAVLKRRQRITDLLSCACCAELLHRSVVFVPCGHVFCQPCVDERMKIAPKDAYDVCEYRCKVCRHVSFDAPAPCPPIDAAVQELLHRGALTEAPLVGGRR